MIMKLPAHLQDIINQEYPTFSNSEFIRRRKAFEESMIARDVSCVIVRGSLRVGAAVQWFTGWPTSHDAIVIFRPNNEPVLFVNHYNHVPLAEKMAQLTEVKWGLQLTSINKFKIFPLN